MSVLDTGLLPWQALACKYIKQKKCDALLLSGGFGSGKTAVNAQILRELCEIRANSGLIIANTYSTIKDTVGVTIDEEIPDPYKKKLIRNPNYEWVLEAFQNNSIIFSRSMRHPHEPKERLKSINADFMWLVEATELPREAFIFGLSRLRKGGEEKYYPVIAETNPSSKSNWVYQFFKDGAKIIYKHPDKTWWVETKDVVYKDHNNEDKTLKTTTINTTTHANPYFPKSTLAYMENAYSPAEVQRFIYNEWNAIEGRVWEKYYTFKHPAGNMAEHAAKYDKIIIGIDPGQDHPTAVAFLGYKDGVWELFDEYRERDRYIESVIKSILKQLESWGLKGRDISCFIDPSARYFKKEMFRYASYTKLHAFSSTHKGTDPALNRAEMLAEKLRTKQLLISDICRETLKDIEQTQYKKLPSGSVTIDKSTYDPDNMDAVGYALQKMTF